MLRIGRATLWKLALRLLCWFGIHDYRLVDVAYGFGGAGGVETVECRRCGVVTRRAA